MEKPARTIKTKFKLVQSASRTKGKVGAAAGTLLLLIASAHAQNRDENDEIENDKSENE